MANTDEFLTLEEAAALLKLSHWTLRRAVQEGRIRHYRLGPRSAIRFRKSELLEDMRVEPVQPTGVGDD